MPAAKIDDGPWLLGSERILEALGFSEVESDERRMLQTVFVSGAMRRADHPFEFWHRFSLARDCHPEIARRLWNHFWRAYSIFYFFSLITIARRSRPTTEQLVAEFSFWQERFVAGSDFFGGDAPDTVDLQLFGVVQMCASIPGPSLEVLRAAPELSRLREWIEIMQRRFASYDHHYTAPHFEPKLAEIETASAPERFCFWCGAVSMWVAFPITLPMVLYFARRIRKKGLQRS
jgi:hypothetical protein